MGEKGGGKLWANKGRGGGCHQVAISPVGRISHQQKRKWLIARRWEGEGGQLKITPNLVGEKENK